MNRCKNCKGCTNCRDCVGCTNCTECTICFNCTNCKDVECCINCTDLTEYSKYMIDNKEYTKEEWYKKCKEIGFSRDPADWWNE